MGVVATGTPLRPGTDARWCVPPSDAGVGDMGQREHWLMSIWAGDGTSFLKASLKNLLLLLLHGRLFNLSPQGLGESLAKLLRRHLCCLADDGYVAASSTFLEASSKRSCVLVL
jgi:hypothetical protein